MKMPMDSPGAARPADMANPSSPIPKALPHCLDVPHPSGGCAGTDSVCMEVFSYTGGVEGGEPDSALSFHAGLPVSSSGLLFGPLEIDIPAGSGVEQRRPLHIVILQRTRSTIPFMQIRVRSRKPCTPTHTHAAAPSKASSEQPVRADRVQQDRFAYMCRPTLSTLSTRCWLK